MYKPLHMCSWLHFPVLALPSLAWGWAAARSPVHLFTVPMPLRACPMCSCGRVPGRLQPRRVQQHAPGARLERGLREPV
jgi:hypothetical protein